MRTLLLGLAFVGSLAAQSEVPTEQCLGGWLISIQADSITLKFNERITTFRLAPDAEIWRHGTDVESIHQLVLGDEIYLKCIRSGDGAVIASIVAAVEEGHGVDMEPHHLKDISVCIGHLVAFTKDTLSVKNDKGSVSSTSPPMRRSGAERSITTPAFSSLAMRWAQGSLLDTPAASSRPKRSTRMLRRRRARLSPCAPTAFWSRRIVCAGARRCFWILVPRSTWTRGNWKRALLCWRLASIWDTIHFVLHRLSSRNKGLAVTERNGAAPHYNGESLWKTIIR